MENKKQNKTKQKIIERENRCMCVARLLIRCRRRFSPSSIGSSEYNELLYRAHSRSEILCRITIF